MKKEKIVTVIVLVILMIEMIAIPVKFLYAKFTLDDVVVKHIDWETQYPFEQEINKNEKQSLIERYQNFVGLIIGKIDAETNNNTLFHDKFVYLYGFLNKNIGMKIVKDIETTTIFLDSGQFDYLYKSRKNIDKTIQDVIELNDYIEDKNMNFLYMQAPLKLFSEKDVVPGCIDNYIYEDKEKICAELLANDVDVFNVVQYLSGEYEEYMEHFYITDHHWKPETGLKVTAVLAEILNEKYDFEIDPDIYDIENYNIKTYENSFLGSLGKKVSLGYTSAENFKFVTPKETQSWSVNMPLVEIETSGDFELIIDENALEVKELYKDNPYAAYTYGDQPYVSIKNHKDGLKSKVLIVGDSYSEVIVPFLAMGCEQVDRIDLRHFNGSFRKFLDSNRYDVVILLQSRAGDEYDSDLNSSGWYFQ